MNAVLTIRLALNEQRAPFEPTMWTLPPNSNTQLKQVWFPGTHSSVGGNDLNHDLSNIALTWMIQQVQDNTELEIDQTYLDASRAIAVVKMDQPWGCADYEPSDTGFWKSAGVKVRTPNHYGTGTNEAVHKCVEAREDYNKGKPNPWTSPDLRGLEFTKLGELEEAMKSHYPAGQV